jgi:hypothetical protein
MCQRRAVSGQRGTRREAQHSHGKQLPRLGPAHESAPDYRRGHLVLIQHTPQSEVGRHARREGGCQ